MGMWLSPDLMQCVSSDAHIFRARSLYAPPPHFFSARDKGIPFGVTHLLRSSLLSDSVGPVSAAYIVRQTGAIVVVAFHVSPGPDNQLQAKDKAVRSLRE